VINLADLVERLLDLGVSGHAVPGLLDLIGGFEEQGLHPAFGEATVEVKERAVLLPWALAATVALAALHESLDQGGMEDFGREAERAQETSLALAQCEGGNAG
jgi:hypothetical protein